MIFGEDKTPKTKKGGGFKKHTFKHAAPLTHYSPPKELKPFKHLSAISLDIETYDPNLAKLGPGDRRKDGFIVGVSIAYSPVEAIYYPLQHNDKSRNIHKQDVFIAKLREELSAYKGELIGANLYYDLSWLDAYYNIKVPHAKIRDVLVGFPLIDENLFSYSLNAAASYFGVQQKNTDYLSALYGEDFIKLFHNVDPGHAAMYANQDTMTAWQVWERQKPILITENLVDVFKMEGELLKLLVFMRAKGIRVSMEAVTKVGEKLKDDEQSLQTKINLLAGFDCDVGKRDNLIRVCEERGIKYPLTEKGTPSFKGAWMASQDDPLLTMIAEKKKKSSLINTFIQGAFTPFIANERLHPTIYSVKGGAHLKADALGTKSGRFSSAHPNILNIPSPKNNPERGSLMRGLFLPEEGELWGAQDWSQIEYRLTVHYAHEVRKMGVQGTFDVVEKYVKDVDTDFHQVVADMTGLDRQKAKRINFGILYGMGLKSTASNLGVSLRDARELLKDYERKMPFAKQLNYLVQAKVNQTGFVRTLLGRKRRYPKFSCGGQLFNTYEEVYHYSSARGGWPIKRAFLHKALNSLIQGSAADLMKKAMLELWQEGVFNTLTPLIMLHDDINVSLPQTKEGFEAFKYMRNKMENIHKLHVPLLVSAETGKNWGSLKDHVF